MTSVANKWLEIIETCLKIIFFLFCLSPKIDNIPERIPRRCVQAYIVRKCFISSFQVNNKLIELPAPWYFEEGRTFFSTNFCCVGFFWGGDVCFILGVFVCLWGFLLGFLWGFFGFVWLGFGFGWFLVFAFLRWFFFVLKFLLGTQSLPEF